jgi:hypothetical protein
MTARARGERAGAVVPSGRPLPVNDVNPACAVGMKLCNTAHFKTYQHQIRTLPGLDLPGMSTPTAARQLTELQRPVARFSQPDLLYLKDIAFRHDQRHKGVVADRAASISWTSVSEAPEYRSPGSARAWCARNAGSLALTPGRIGWRNPTCPRGCDTDGVFVTSRLHGNSLNGG